MNIITFPTGNVGIGTETPNQTLEIAGTLRLTGSTGSGDNLMGRNNLGDVSTITVGSGLSLIERTLISTGSTGGGISGTGTTNYIPKWNSSTSLTDSIIFQSGISVGINTTSMNSDGLDIKGSMYSLDGQLGPELATTGTTSGAWTGTSFADGYTHITGNTTSITTTIAAVAGNVYQVSYTISGGTSGLAVNISFGGLYPTTFVSVSGSFLLVRTTSNATLTVRPQLSTFNRTVSVSIKQLIPAKKTFILKNSANNIVFEQRLSTSESNIFQGNLSGEISAGSLNNTFKGFQAGRYITNGASNCYYGANSAISSTQSASNSFYGAYSGRDAATSIVQNTSNATAIGIYSGSNATSNVNNFSYIGAFCGLAAAGTVTIGYFANRNNNSGNSIFIGNLAGAGIGGANNVVIGAKAFTLSAPSSDSSVILGARAAALSTTSTQNVIIGESAGGSPTIVSSACVLIGYQTRLSINGETGAVVIGHQAISLGSNTTVLGNSGTTRSKIWGSIENQGAGATNATTSLLIQNSASTPKLTVKGGGAIEIGSNATVTGTTTATIQVVDSSNANVGLALAPKGSGAFTLLIPSNTITGGNSRGFKAVDLQMSLSSASSIASGSFAFIGGGSGNTASSLGSTIAGGTNNTITDSYSSINGGNGNTVNSTYSTIIGGSNNLIASTYNYSSIIGGRDNGVYALYSIASGYNASAYLYGQSAKASGFFTNQGDSQTSKFILRRTIIGTGSTELLLDGSTLQLLLSGGTTNRLWTFTVQIAAFVSSGGTVNCPNASSWSSVHNGGIKLSGTTTTLLGVSLVNSYSDSSMSTAIVTIAANDTTDALTIFFKPPTTAISTTVTSVVANVKITEVGFN
jgi:hypothetical protein